MRKKTSRSLEDPPPCEQSSKGLTGKWASRCTSTGQDGSNELDLEWIGPVVVELRRLQSFVRMNRRMDTQMKKYITDGDNSKSSFFLWKEQGTKSIKMPSDQYTKSHSGDKTIKKWSYLCHVIFDMDQHLYIQSTPWRPQNTSFILCFFQHVFSFCTSYCDPVATTRIHVRNSHLSPNYS